MTKKLIALGLAVMLVGVSVVSGTLAYLTDTDKATNVFTVGNIEIDLDEATGVYDALGNIMSDKYTVYENGTVFDNIMPGNYIKKEVTLENTDSKNDAYVRVIVILNNWLDTYNALITYTDAAERDAVLDSVFDGWNADFANDYNQIVMTDTDSDKYIDIDATTKIVDNTVLDPDNWFKNEYDPENDWRTNSPNDDGYYAKILGEYEMCYAYYMLLEPGDKVTLFEGLNVPAEFGAEQLKMFEDLKVEVYADAIQVEGFADAKSAFEALNDAHPIEELRPAEGTSIEDVIGSSLPKAEVKKLDTVKKTELATDSGLSAFADADGDGIVTEEEYNELIPYALCVDATEIAGDLDEQFYAKYNADYIISFSKDIDNNQTLDDLMGDAGNEMLANCNDQIALVGEYGYAGCYPCPMYLPDSAGNIKADTEYRVMQIFASLDPAYEGFFPLSYEFVLDFVNEFNCGIVAVPGNSIPEDTVVNLELRLYETELNSETGEYEETGKFFTLVTDSYTFEA